METSSRILKKTFCFVYGKALSAITAKSLQFYVVCSNFFSSEKKEESKIMRNSVLFGAGSYSIDSTVFQGPDLIKNDKKRKRVEKAFAKQKATLEQLHDSFKLEYGKHKSKTPSSVDEYMPDFVKIHFTMPDGKPAQEEISRGGFNWTYGSLVRKAMSRAQELSDYFHPKVKDDQKAKEDKGKS